MKFVALHKLACHCKCASGASFYKKVVVVPCASRRLVLQWVWPLQHHSLRLRWDDAFLLPPRSADEHNGCKDYGMLPWSRWRRRYLSMTWVVKEVSCAWSRTKWRIVFRTWRPGLFKQFRLFRNYSLSMNSSFTSSSILPRWSVPAVERINSLRFAKVRLTWDRKTYP